MNRSKLIISANFVLELHFWRLGANKCADRINENHHIWQICLMAKFLYITPILERMCRYICYEFFFHKGANHAGSRVASAPELMKARQSRSLIWLWLQWRQDRPWWPSTVTEAQQTQLRDGSSETKNCYSNCSIVHLSNTLDNRSALSHSPDQGEHAIWRRARTTGYWLFVTSLTNI